MSEAKKDLSRRGFLANAGKGLAAVQAIGAVAATRAAAQQVPEPPGRKLGWAIVGLGSLAINQILPAFARSEKSRVTALVSGHPDKARKLAARYGVAEKAIYDYQGYDKIASNPEIDVVYVVLPNSMHAEYTIRALKAGKHVLCEKPMANTPAECQAMIDAARAASRKLMVAYRCRYEPFNQEMIRMAREQELGPTKVIVADHGFNIGDPGQWRLKRALAGGGSLMDIGVYSLQAARYVTGEEPVRAQRDESTRRRATSASRKSRRRSTSSCASRAVSSPTAAPATATPGRTATASSRRKAGSSSSRRRATRGCACACAAATSPRSAACPCATTSRWRWTTCPSASWPTRSR